MIRIKWSTKFHEVPTEMMKFLVFRVDDEFINRQFYNQENISYNCFKCLVRRYCHENQFQKVDMAYVYALNSVALKKNNC